MCVGGLLVCLTDLARLQAVLGKHCSTGVQVLRPWHEVLWVFDSPATSTADVNDKRALTVVLDSSKHQPPRAPNSSSGSAATYRYMPGGSVTGF